MLSYQQYHNITAGLFVLLGLYWLIMAANIKSASYRQTRFSRIVYLLCLALAFGLLYSPVFSASWLRFSLLPKDDATGITGVILCASGVFFAIWARKILGTNWSGEITLKKDHELIRSGPYSLARHPIYTGILTAMLGSAIVTGELRGFIAVLIAFFGFMHKMRKEEELMMRQFPNEYPAYKEQVSKLIPFLF